MGKYLAKVGSRNLGFPMERLKKSKYLPRSLQMDCSGALAAQEVEKFSPPQEKYHENDEGITRLHVLTKKLEKWMKDCASLLSVAAALVTTVTFLASITMPGSISIDNGLPIFVKAFVVSNMFTLLFSTASLLMFLCILGQKILCPLPWKLMFCGVLTLFMSIIAMIPAFCAGLLIVLGHKKPCLVIPVIVLYYVTATFFFVHQILFIVRMNKSTYYPDIFRKSSTPRQYTKGINSEANIPKYLKSALHYLFALVSNQITIVVEEHYDGGISRNQVYDAAEVYLRTKMSPEVRRFKVGKPPKQKSLDISVEKGEEIIDRFDNILELKWRFISVKPQNQNGYENEKRFFELSFNKKYRDRVLIEYLPFVLAKSKETKDNADDDSYGGGMTEHEPGLVDSTTIISMMDFDTADNSAHLMREYQSGLAVSLSENKSGGEALKREFVTKDSILGLVDLQQNSGGRRDDGAKSFGTIYDPGIHTTHSLARNSFKVLENPPMLETLAIYPKLMGKNSDLWKFLRRKNREEKPLVEFDSTNNSTYQSGLLVSNSENTNSREESKRWCVTERVLGSVDSTTRILSTDFDAAINSAHLVRPYQSGPVVSLSGNENRGEASKRECITKRILGSEDLQQNSGGRRDNAAKSFGAIYDPGIHPTHSLAQNSFEVLENPPMLETLAIYPKLMGKISDLWKFVRGKNREEKPLVEFDSTNNSAYQSGLLVSNSENTNSREESKRACMTERVLGSVDSTTRISSTDFDAADNTAHLGRACQSGPVVSLSGNANRGEASERECITERILGLEDLQQNFGDRCDNAAKSFGTIYDPVIHTTHSLAQNSLEVLDALPNQKQPNDSITLLSLGRLTLEGCVLEEKSQDLPRPMQINGVEQRVTKSPPYLGGFTAQSTSSSRWPISLPDGRHIVVLNPLEQSTKNVAHVARAPSVSLPEKMVRKTLKRKCRIMSVIYASHQKCFGKRCEGTAKSFRAMHICRNRGINWVSTVKRIHKQHGINKWPFCQKWATRKGYSLGEKRPYEVSSQSMDEKLVSKFLFIHMSQFPIFSPLPLTLPNSSEIVGPIALSSDKFAATNNRAHLVRQNQSGSTASHYERKNTRETLGRQRITESLSSIEDLQQHFACKHKDAVKRLGVKVSIFKSSCRQHWVYWLPCQIIKNEQQALDATSNIAHVVKADLGIPTVSCSEMENKTESLKRECGGLSLEDLPEHYGGRHEDAMKGLGDSLAWKSFEVLESLPLGEQSIIRHFAQRRTPTYKDCVQRKKSQDLPQSLQMDCSRGLAAQGYSLGGERPDEVLSLSMEEKLVSRLQFLHMAWLARSSRHPLALQSGSEILGHIALSSSEFIATNNGVRPGRQDQGGSSASHPERGRARETNYREDISLEDLEKLKGKNRDDAAKSLGVGVTTFKSICRYHGISDWKKFRVSSSSIKPRPNFGSDRGSSPSIPPWPNLGSDHVFAPADPNGENNPSPTSNTLSTNGQTTTDIEMGGPNSEPIECIRNSIEVPTSQNIGNGSIAEFEDLTTFHDCRDADFHFSDVYNEAAGGSGNFCEQVFESSSSIYLVYSDAAAPSQPVPTTLPTLPHSQIASTQIQGENMESFEDWRNLLAPQKEPFPDGHVSGSVNYTIGSISDLAQSQPMSTTPHTTESPEYLRDVSASVVKHRMETNHYGSSNLIDPSCSDIALSQPIPTIPHMTPTEGQDSTFVKIYATYGEYLIKLHLPLMPGIMEMKQAVSKQLGLGLDSFKVMYKDECGLWILMTHDEEVRELLQLTASENQVSNRLVVIKVPNTTDFSGNCECDKC